MAMVVEHSIGVGHNISGLRQGCAFGGGRIATIVPQLE